MRKLISIMTLVCNSLFCFAQMDFNEVRLRDGSDLRLFGRSGIPTDAGDIVFQKLDGEEMARIRSHYDETSGLASILLSTTPQIRDYYWFGGDGNFGIGKPLPRARLEVDAPFTNISTGVLHSNGHQSWGHVLALVTDDPTGDDPKLLFSYRNKSKHWALGGSHNSSAFHVREDGGDGFHGTGGGIARLTVAEGGNVGIGMETPLEKLSVNGKIRAHEIKVETSHWPDYVFQEGYDLKPLTEVNQFIKTNGHLPEIPKASEVEADGISLGEMNKLLLKKIEELTLYILKQQEELDIIKCKVQMLEIK